MIRQRKVTVKTTTATLTIAEMGDILCNSLTAFTVTLPTGSSGLWYQIHNVGTGVISISSGTVLTTLNQYESATVLYDTAASAWTYSKGGGGTSEVDIVTADTTSSLLADDSSALVLSTPTGPITLSLPTMAEGLNYIIRNLSADQIVTVRGAEQSGGFDSYAKALLHFNGDDASTTFTDESGKTWTASGNAQLDTAQKEFGSASLLLDGTDDYITSADSDDFYFGAGNFTIDMWIRVTTVTGLQCVFSQSTDANNFIMFYVDGANMTFYCMASSAAVAYYGFTTAFSVNTWYHVALVRNGTDVKVYKNGTAVTRTSTVAISTSSIPNFTRDAYIGIRDRGGTLDRPFAGWIDEYRISKGIARWTANFTAPTSEYVATTYDELDGSQTGIALTTQQCLRVICDGTEWWSVHPSLHDLLSLWHSDTLADSVAAGDILIGNATPKWARLAKGTEGYALLMGAALPAWTNLASTYVKFTDTPPVAANSAGTPTTIAWDASYLYVCTATDTWIRIALTAW